MRSVPYYFIFCLLFPFSVLARENIPASVREASSDTGKLLAYEMIYNHFQFSNRDSAIYYLEQGLNLFTDLKYEEGRATMLRMLGAKYIEQSMMPLAREREDEALAILTRLHDNNGIAAAQNLLGVIDGKTGLYGSAIQHFITALKLYESTGNTIGQTECYLKLGTANSYASGFETALGYYNKALALATKNADTVNIVNIYNNIGVLYGKKHDSAAAAVNLQKALDICAVYPESAYIRVDPLTNMGNIYDDLNQDAKALSFYRQALEIATREHMEESCIRLTVNIASVEVSKNPKAALDTLYRALDMARAIGQRILQVEVMATIEDVYRHEKNYEKAYDMLQQRTDLRDSLFTTSKAKEIATVQSVYELDKANEKMANLEATGKRQRIQRNALAITILELVLALILLGFFFRKTRRLNTALKLHEIELEKANKIKDRLFSIIGHDLRNPVANIPVMVDMFMDPATTEEEKVFMLQELRTGATASLETLDKLLNWGRSLIKNGSSQKSIFNPNDYIQNEFKLLKAAADHKQLHINNLIPDGINVIADPEHFKFIIRNLVSNAIKFSYPGQTITVDADSESRPGYVVFSVADNGMGMTEEKKSEIFAPYNVSMPGTANEKGNGIGLMLCMEFVQEDRGSIWVKSEKDKGATFFFSLKRSM